jgi:putative hydrolase of the HAD superfamily
MVDFKLPGPMFTWERVAWVKGAEDALKALAGYTCCIATNAGQSDSEAVKKGLARVGADTYFTFIFSSWDIGFEKPDPRFFRFIIEKLGTDAANCIMIGDNYEKDIIAAKTAGMKTIFLNHSDQREPFPHADSVIQEMDQLSVIIEKL